MFAPIKYFHFHMAIHFVNNHFYLCVELTTATHSFSLPNVSILTCCMEMSSASNNFEGHDVSWTSYLFCSPR